MYDEQSIKIVGPGHTETMSSLAFSLDKEPGHYCSHEQLYKHLGHQECDPPWRMKAHWASSWTCQMDMHLMACNSLWWLGSHTKKWGTPHFFFFSKVAEWRGQRPLVTAQAILTRSLPAKELPKSTSSRALALFCPAGSPVIRTPGENQGALKENKKFSVNTLPHSHTPSQPHCLIDTHTPLTQSLELCGVPLQLPDDTG